MPDYFTDPSHPISPMNPASPASPMNPVWQSSSSHTSSSTAARGGPKDVGAPVWGAGLLSILCFALAAYATIRGLSKGRGP